MSDEVLLIVDSVTQGWINVKDAQEKEQVARKQGKPIEIGTSPVNFLRIGERI